MARLTQKQWTKARADYEIAGMSVSAISKKYKVSRTAIQKHMKDETWTQDLEGVIKRKATEKLAGKLADATDEQNAKAIDQEAAKRAGVIELHRKEFTAVRAPLHAALKKLNAEIEKGATSYDVMRTLKLSIDSLARIHDMEIAAYRLEAHVEDAAKGDGKLQIEII